MTGPPIAHLADRPDDARIIAVWFRQEWRTHYGPYGLGEIEAEIAEGANRDRLPLTLVALHDRAGGTVRPVATATIRAESFGDLPAALGAPGPWLGGLYVVPERRGEGLALALLARAVAEARSLGHETLFAGTATAAPLFARAGWEEVGSLPWHGTLVTVFATGT